MLFSLFSSSSSSLFVATYVTPFPALLVIPSACRTTQQKQAKFESLLSSVRMRLAAQSANAGTQVIKSTIVSVSAGDM